MLKAILPAALSTATGKLMVSAKKPVEPTMTRSSPALPLMLSRDRVRSTSTRSLFTPW